MSDYFSRLAERALGTAAAPRPVIPSRFEQAALAGEADDFTIEDEERAAAAARPGQPDEGSSRPQAASPPSPAEPRDGRPATAAPPLPGAADSAVPTPEREEHGEPARLPERPVTERPPIVERERIVVERDVEAPREPVQAATPDRPAAVERVQRVEARPVAPTPISPTPHAPEWERDDVAAGPPTVHVTIGRVDVRAVSAPAPVERPPAHRQRPARPSLEEYLRRSRDGR
jgi:hypothetical protein